MLKPFERRARASATHPAWASLRMAAALSLLVMSALGPLAGCATQRPARFVDLTEVSQPPGPVSEASGAEPALRVAVSSIVSPANTRRLYEELIEYVGEKSGRRVIFKQRRTYAEVNSLLARGEVDMAFLCSGQYVVAHDRFHTRLLAVPVVRGQTVYRSYVIVGARSGITSFEQLRGKRFAFVDPLSNTGYLVPVSWLAQRGESPDSFFASYLFTDSHDNSIQATADGVVDGAAVDSLIYESLRESAPELVSRTRVIARSRPFGNPPVVVRAGLEPELEATLRQILLSMHKDPRGAAILKKLSVDRFAPGDDAAYDEVRKMRAFLTSQTDRARTPPQGGG